MKSIIKSKIRNAEKLVILKAKGKERYLLLIYKKESMGAKSDYKKVPCVYILSLYFDEGYYNTGKITGRNITRVEKDIELNLSNGNLEQVNTYPDWDSLPDYTTWQIERLRTKNLRV